MDRVPLEVWLIGVIALALAVIRVRLGIDRRRAAGNEQRFQSWSHHVTVGLILAGAGAAWITIGLGPPVALSWLVAINLVAMAFYGWDKLAAKLVVARVPENTLHLLALAGGSIGALIGQNMFHHKTRKLGFQVKFWSVVAFQLVLLSVYIRSQATPS